MRRRLVVVLAAFVLGACATVGGHYVSLPPDPKACLAATIQAAVDQLPCDEAKPELQVCLAAAGAAAIALLPCAPSEVWVADPKPVAKPDGGL